MNILSSAEGFKTRYPQMSSTSILPTYIHNVRKLSPTESSIINGLARTAFAISAFVPYIIVALAMVGVNSVVYLKHKISKEIPESNKPLLNKKALAIASIGALAIIYIGYTNKDMTFQAVESSKNRVHEHFYQKQQNSPNALPVGITDLLDNIIVKTALPAIVAPLLTFFTLRFIKNKGSNSEEISNYIKEAQSLEEKAKRHQSKGENISAIMYFSRAIEALKNTKKKGDIDTDNTKITELTQTIDELKRKFNQEIQVPQKIQDIIGAQCRTSIQNQSRYSKQPKHSKRPKQPKHLILTKYSNQPRQRYS